MIDGVIYIIGAIFAFVGMLGILTFVTSWSVDQALKLTKFGGIITAWYVDKLRKERDAKRNAA